MVFQRKYECFTYLKGNMFLFILPVTESSISVVCEITSLYASIREEEAVCASPNGKKIEDSCLAGELQIHF